MARRRKSLASISQERAHQALTFLVHEGKIATVEIERALKRRKKLLADLQSRLAALGEEGVAMIRRAGKDGPFPILRKGTRRTRQTTRKGRSKPRKAISVLQRKARQDQGRYMAAVRRLSKQARRQIKTIREKSGVKSAIAAAKKMASS